MSQNGNALVIDPRDYPWYSEHPQDPDKIRVIEGKEVIVDGRGKPMFYLDGRSYKEKQCHQCKRKLANSPYRCTRRATCKHGYVVCQVHGSGSPLQGRPGGTKKPTKYEKMPTDLKERFDKLLEDPDYLTLEAEIRMVDVRLEQLVQRLPSDETSAYNFNQLQKGIELFERAEEMKVDDPERATDLILDAINTIRNSGSELQKERMVWDEYVQLSAHRSRLSMKESEIKRQTKNSFSAEQGFALVAFLVQVVKKHVLDPQIRKAIAIEIDMAMSGEKEMVVDGEAITIT